MATIVERYVTIYYKVLWMQKLSELNSSANEIINDLWLIKDKGVIFYTQIGHTHTLLKMQNNASLGCLTLFTHLIIVNNFIIQAISYFINLKQTCFLSAQLCLRYIYTDYNVHNILILSSIFQFDKLFVGSPQLLVEPQPTLATRLNPSLFQPPESTLAYSSHQTQPQPTLNT